MTKINTYSISGTKVTPTDLPKNLSDEINKGLLAQAIRVFENRIHSNKPITQTRADVDLTKKKIYRQKGTGRARHGAASAPIFVGGGKAHGPTGERRKLTMSKKMRQKALASAVSLKLSQNKLVVIDGVSKIEKTKIASKFIEKIYKDGKTSVFLSTANKEKAKVFRNIRNVKVFPFDSVNAHKIYLGGFIIFDKDALQTKTKVAEKAKVKKAEVKKAEVKKTEVKKTKVKSVKKVIKK